MEIEASSRTADKAMIRFPPGMRNEIKGLAEAGYRSMNAEIVARLRRDIDREKSTSGQQA